MPVTRDDVAREAGVSVATVSYVLNAGPKPVSQEKRQRVLAAVTALGYRPNAIARSLRARRTRILGLVLPDSANPYFARLSRALEDAAAGRGYQVVVSNAGEDMEREAAQIEAMLRLQVDGLVWIPADLGGEAQSATLPPVSVPTVQVDRATRAALRRDGHLDAERLGRTDVIESDNRQGGRIAAEHLLSLGHRRIAFLSGTAGHAHTEERLRGACEAIERAGMGSGPALVAYGDFSYAAGDDHARRWWRLPARQRPTAIQCANDSMAIGVLSALAELGVRVPEEVAVVGYDDVPQARFTVPPLTTVAQPLDDMAQEAIERLLARIEGGAGGGAAPDVRLYPVTLVMRKSTARLQAATASG